MKKLEGEGGSWEPLEYFKDDEGKAIGSSILYELGKDDFSHLHKLKEDELWILIKGEVTQLLLYPNGSWEIRHLDQASPASMVRKGVWQASWTEQVALVSCVLCPPFSSFEMADSSIRQSYPDCPYIDKVLV